MSNEKKYEVSLVEVIKNNYDSIQNGTYNWKDEEVEAVYKLCRSILKRNVFYSSEDIEDALNEMATKFFSTIVKSIDINIDGISSYITTALTNTYYVYNKKYKKYHERKGESLDATIFSNDETTTRLDLLGEKNDFFAYDIKKEYINFVNQEIRKFPLLNRILVNGETQVEIAKKENCTRANISRLYIREKDAFKLWAIERGFSMSDIFSKNNESNLYKRIEQTIADNGLLKTIYILKKHPQVIANALELDSDSIRFVINVLMEEKIEMLESKNIKEARAIVKFTKRYFPELLATIEKMDQSFYSKIENIINENELFVEYFKNNRTIKELSEDNGVISGMIESKLNGYKGRIRKDFNEYLKTTQVKKI